VTVSVRSLQEDLQGRVLPGGRITIEPHESAIGDHALHARDDGAGIAHPYWFIVASLRGMGISVSELCALAHQSADDTLLFGACEVVQDTPMMVGTSYRSTAEITEIDSRLTRDGSRLDSLVVVVHLFEDSNASDAPIGAITSTYLFKRGEST